MRFDLRVRYVNGNLIVQSQAANHVESVTAIVCLSRETESAVEQIYSVGIAADTVKGGFSKNILTTTLGYRFIDPFSPSSFDGDIASKAVAYMFMSTRKRLFPNRDWWWRFVGNIGSVLVVEIPGYSRLPASSRAEFESGINRFVGGVKFTVAG